MINVFHTQVYSVGHQIYQVVDGNLEFVVEILKRSCTCCKWDLDEIPCSHACAAIRKANLCHYTYVSDFYMKDVFVSTYNGIIHPVGSQKFWDIPDIVKDHVVLPPIVRRRASRPKRRGFLQLVKKRGKSSVVGSMKMDTIVKDVEMLFM